MSLEYVIKGENIEKKFKGFTLAIPEFKIPKGFATALIGENGAGKSTLMNILAGIRLDAKGTIRYFDEYDQVERENANQKERIGYVGPGHYYLPHWTVKQVEEVSGIMFEGFHKDKFESLCQELAVYGTGGFDKAKKVSSFSDGTKMKLMLANVLARDTEALILDEPASPLDPLMREKLCEMIQSYIEEGNGERSVFFSTHNVSDMENITDYAIIMEHGKIVEEGFVVDLKEKYILVKGDAEDKAKAKEVLYTMTANNYGFEGICLAENLDKLAGMNITKEIPSLYQISVAVMKANSMMGR
ncbi:MAG: ABC transporter ATP-binding protein [Agathobacter sp.]|nr:ABC transporter ATP-binding protein [Agathobacter sp.]